jgi:hypothetical protein
MDRSMRQRVQERQVQPNQRIELRRFEGDQQRPESDKPRTQRKVERESHKVDDGFGTDAKRGTNRFEPDSKTTPKNAWFEKETGVERDIQEIKIKPRLNQNDGNLKLDVKLSEESSAETSENGVWVVDVEEIVKDSKTARSGKQLKRSEKKSESDNIRIEVEIEDETGDNAGKLEAPEKTKKK